MNLKPDRNQQDLENAEFLRGAFLSLDGDIPVPAAAQAEHLKNHLAEPRAFAGMRWRPAMAMASLALVAVLGVFIAFLAMGTGGFSQSSLQTAAPAAGAAAESSSAAVTATFNESADMVEESAVYDEEKPEVPAVMAQNYEEIRSRLTEIQRAAAPESKEIASSVSGDTVSSKTGMPVSKSGDGAAAVVSGEYLYCLRSGEESGAAPALFAIHTGSMSLSAQLPLAGPDAELFFAGEDLAVLTSSPAGQKDAVTASFYSLAEPGQPRLKGSFSQGGRYTAAQLEDGVLYLATRLDAAGDIAGLPGPDLAPWISSSALDSQPRSLDAGRVALPADGLSPSYTVVSALPLSDLGAAASSAVLGSGGPALFSGQNLFVLEPCPEKDMTYLCRLSLSDGEILFAAEGSIPGLLEKSAAGASDGLLRVVTSSAQGLSHSVFVLDEDLNAVGSIEKIAEGMPVAEVKLSGSLCCLIAGEEEKELIAIDLSDPAAPALRALPGVSPVPDLLLPLPVSQMLGVSALEKSPPNTVPQLTLFDLSGPCASGAPVSPLSPAGLSSRGLMALPSSLCGLERGTLLLYTAAADGVRFNREISHTANEAGRTGGAFSIRCAVADEKNLYTISEAAVQARSLDDLGALSGELLLPS
ncbi:MAG: beta-propeller domain-containing protein [Oscillospiraceae bacterium]|nr:beta-propeller domain-containing protein [Oscillospiraceae bacterium]